MKPNQELRHLLNGSNSDKKSQGFYLFIFNVYCLDNAEEVLKNCQEVLEIIFRQRERKIWLSEIEWYQILPNWFVSNCAPEKTIQEEEKNNAKWQTLSVEKRLIEIQNEAWSVMDFVSWFEPDENGLDERYWSWWNAFTQSPKLLTVSVEILDFPFPYGCLTWLFKASSAIKVETEF